MRILIKLAVQSDFGICCTHMAKGIFSHDAIPSKYCCTDEDSRFDQAMRACFQTVPSTYPAC